MVSLLSFSRSWRTPTPFLLRKTGYESFGDLFFPTAPRTIPTALFFSWLQQGFSIWSGSGLLGERWRRPPFPFLQLSYRKKRVLLSLCPGYVSPPLPSAKYPLGWTRAMRNTPFCTGLPPSSLPPSFRGGFSVCSGGFVFPRATPPSLPRSRSNIARFP